MAPGSRQRQQQNGQKQQQSSPAAATVQQAHQLLQRLAAAPDLSLFRDKLDRVQQLALQQLLSLPASKELLLLLAAAVTTSLRHLQPLLLQLDLPKNAAVCIHALSEVLYTYSLQLIRHSVSESWQDPQPSNWSMMQQQLVQQVADTGGHWLQWP
jgi:hypothetical protein